MTARFPKWSSLVLTLTLCASIAATLVLLYYKQQQFDPLRMEMLQHMQTSADWQSNKSLVQKLNQGLTQQLYLTVLVGAVGLLSYLMLLHYLIQLRYYQQPQQSWYQAVWPALLAVLPLLHIWFLPKHIQHFSQRNGLARLGRGLLVLNLALLLVSLLVPRMVATDTPSLNVWLPRLWQLENIEYLSWLAIAFWLLSAVALIKNTMRGELTLA